LNKKDALKEVKDAKTSLKLTDKGSTQSRYLSGGMKRKLSVGIALCAGSKVTLLMCSWIIVIELLTSNQSTLIKQVINWHYAGSGVSKKNWLCVLLQ